MVLQASLKLADFFVSSGKSSAGLSQLFRAGSLSSLFELLFGNDQRLFDGQTRRPGCVEIALAGSASLKQTLNPVEPLGQIVQLRSGAFDFSLHPGHFFLSRSLDEFFQLMKHDVAVGLSRRQFNPDSLQFERKQPSFVVSVGIHGIAFFSKHLVHAAGDRAAHDAATRRLDSSHKHPTGRHLTLGDDPCSNGDGVVGVCPEFNRYKQCSAQADKTLIQNTIHLFFAQQFETFMLT